MSLLKIDKLSKIYKMGEVEVVALKEVSFSINVGEFIVILGPSGSGKSTLLNIIGGMDQPTMGSVVIDGQDLTQLDDKGLTTFRRHKVGFVFQFYNLMANLTAKENVEMATEICENPLVIDKVLQDVGLFERSAHFPSQMSGGEQQRIAIARAVAKNPKMLLCDEPTGALDYQTGIKILSLLKKVNENYQKTVIVITHNASIGEMADRVIKMRSGLITEIRENRQKITPEGIKW